MLLQLVMAIFILFIFKLLIKAEEYNGILVFSAFGGFWAIQFILVAVKSVHIKIDVENEKALFGNIFFSNECGYQLIKEINKSFYPNIYCIKIEDKKYNFYNARLDLNQIQQSLKLDS